MFEIRFVGGLLCAAALCTGACTTTDSGDGSGDGAGDDVDAGSPDAAGGVADAGAGGDCPSDIVATPAAPACAAATRTCLDACDTDECVDMCLAMDPDADGCEGCLDDAFIACVNGMGCQAQWDELGCCFDGCDDPESPACETTCASQGGAFDTCLTDFEDTCDAEVDTVCFTP